MVRIVVLLTLLLVTSNEVHAETIELGYRLDMGTYTIPVQIPGLDERSLTFDTGASMTVLRIEDIEMLRLQSQGLVGVTFPLQGVLVEAHFYIVPEMRVGGCTILNSQVIGMSLPEGRPGVLGMSDLERLSPFTFKGNGQLETSCP